MLGIRREQIARPLRRFRLCRTGDREAADHRRQPGQPEIPRPGAGGQAAAARVRRRSTAAGAGASCRTTTSAGSCSRELGELLGLSGEPEFFEVARWLGMMPQYHVGHLDLVRQIEERAAAIPEFRPGRATPIAAWACRFASRAANRRRSTSSKPRPVVGVNRGSTSDLRSTLTNGQGFAADHFRLVAVDKQPKLVPAAACQLTRSPRPATRMSAQRVVRRQQPFDGGPLRMLPPTAIPPKPSRSIRAALEIARPAAAKCCWSRRANCPRPR